MDNDQYEAFEKMKNELKEKISKVESLMGELGDEKEKIRVAYQTIQDDVATPIEFPTYDLSDDGNWQGVNYNKACDQLGEITEKLNKYQTDVDGVMGQIGTAIDRLQVVLDDLYEQLAALG